MSARRRYLTLGAAAGLTLVADQVTKQAALEALADGPVDVVAGVLRFRLTFNSGGAFGILQGLPGLFLIATVVIVAVIAASARRIDDGRWFLPLGLVLGGGLGNGTDRLLRDPGGRVVDFIDLYVWPVFNLADMAIVTGVVLMLWLGWRAET